MVPLPDVRSPPLNDDHGPADIGPVPRPRRRPTEETPVDDSKIIATALLAAAAFVPAAPALADTPAQTPYAVTAAAACPSKDAQAAITTLNALTTVMQEVQTPAAQISLMSWLMAPVGEGVVPKVSTGLTGVATTTVQAFDQFSALKPITDACDAAAVLDVYQAYTAASTTTINILIGKAGSLLPGFGYELSAPLRFSENTNDALPYTLMNLLPKQTADIQAAYEPLERAVTSASNAYSGSGF